MKGIVFLDADGDLGWRSQEFLDHTDPQFISNNYPFILKAWMFDTDNFDQMYTMFSSMKSLRLTTAAVAALAKAIDFDLHRLKERK